MNTGEVIYPEDTYFSETNRMLWQYLNATKKILVLKSIHPKTLEISSEYISRLIENGDENLMNYVPEKVYQQIKRDKLFGYNRNKSRIEL
jgi:competence CoiA-like predicted nuclease